jgi:hypothetical protein
MRRRILRAQESADSVKASGAAPRLLPDEPFPPYAFVPGRFPHPTADPAGHSFGTNPALPSRIEPDQWQGCRPYLFGIDLFNAGYYWESHVAWEGLWMACDRKGIVADFLKGLIHLAAAGVKALEGRPEGVKSHSSRAAALWETTLRSLNADHDLFMGFNIEDLVRVAKAIHGDGWPARPPFLLPSFPK